MRIWTRSKRRVYLSPLSPLSADDEFRVAHTGLELKLVAAVPGNRHVIACAGPPLLADLPAVDAESNIADIGAHIHVAVRRCGAPDRQLADSGLRVDAAFGHVDFQRAGADIRLDARLNSLHVQVADTHFHVKLKTRRNFDCP